MRQFLQNLLKVESRPRTRKTVAVSGTVEFLETSRLVAAFIFVTTIAAIVVISFVGVNTVTLPVLENQLASVRIVAGAPFKYESAIRTAQRGEQLRERVPRVYRLDDESLKQFETHLRELLVDLVSFERAHTPLPLPAPGAPPPPAPLTGERRAELTAITDIFNAKGPYRAGVEDVATLLNAGGPAARNALVENGLIILREIYSEGVHDNASFSRYAERGRMPVFQIVRPDGDVVPRATQSMEEALTFLRINLSAEATSRDLSLALFRILRNGVSPNLIFDREATLRRENEAIQGLQPVTVSVERGQTIIEPGTRVTKEQFEMLVAQRAFLQEQPGLALNEGLQLFGRILLVLAMVMASVFYIRLEDRETVQSNGRLALLALVVIVNLALVRATYALTELDYFTRDSSTASVLPFLAPTALAPIIVAILINAGSAIFMALLISIFTSVIYGNRLDLLVLTFLAAMVGIFCSQHTRKRSKVVRATFLGGLTVAAFALLFGIVDQIQPVTIIKHISAGVITGLLTGVAVLGLLPLLEGLFKRTTDITLLELTDYNHPLLRLMQMEAPGTYHHSLVVAQLAENAAGAIDANPLLARVCALFHDIGKTAKPEYFSENQHDGVNPHDDNNPSLSALVIKSHVKDGVDLALKHKLPRRVIDVIQQHHGTTLIRFFYQRALKGGRPAAGTTPPMRRPDSAEPFLPPGLAPSPVSETTYRYDGPRPQFKESAIIHLADGVEAASRSLRKVTPQHLGELIDQIFRDRLDDGQLDEAPLTLEEINRIKTSFTFTLLNMLHSRVAYPPADASSAAQPAT